MARAALLLLLPPPPSSATLASAPAAATPTPLEALAALKADVARTLLAGGDVSVDDGQPHHNVLYPLEPQKAQRVAQLSGG